MARSTGLGLCESLAVLALLAFALALVLPAADRLRRDAITAAAARHVALGLQSLRWKSVTLGVAHGWWFRRDDLGWFWLEVVDGNGNGLRVAEVLAGIDPTLSGPHRLEDRSAPATFGFPRKRAEWPAVPPRRGTLHPDGDPIRFGRTDLVAFGPMGASSSGTIYVTDSGRRMYAVVLFGPTGRTRIWRLDVGTGSWRR